MLPADQRLHFTDLASIEIDDRLEVHAQVPVVERAAKVGFESPLVLP